MTANNAWSMRRRLSNRVGKNVPARSLGIFKSSSPAVVVNTRRRVPLRWVVRSSEGSNGTAPMNAVAWDCPRFS
ncbi:hypothetical protein RCH11_000753 [Glaciihabitans sp. GrIS 2.15]|nr:hypothetical protein [Glaciihabitans sp. GrIS 2.15]